jgi:hypothetical protein
LDSSASESIRNLQDADGQAHSALSYLYLLERRFDEALEAGRIAVANRPSCAYANCFYGNVLHYCGKHDADIHHLKLAMRVHRFIHRSTSTCSHWRTGQRENSIWRTPNDVANRIVVISAYVGQKQWDLAKEVAVELKRIDPSFSIARFASGQPYRDIS